MSGLDLNALKQAQEELNSGGGGFFTRLDKDNLTKDIRILEPTPSMLGKFWVEAQQWWIDGKPILVDQDSTVVEDILAQFEEEFGTSEAAKAEWKELRYASKGQGQHKIQKSTVYWLPILEFEWKLTRDNELDGIYGADGEYDVAKIKQFIVGGGPKVLDAKMSLLKNILGHITTGRDGKFFLDQEKGFNLSIQRAGAGTKTTYTSTKQEQMPMPSDFYGDGALDMVEVVRANEHSDAYVEAVLANYFFGEALPENPEYKNPELRKKFGSGEGQEEEKSTKTRSRRRAQVEEKKEEEKPATRTRQASAEETADAPRTRRSRSLVDDVAGATDD